MAHDFPEPSADEELEFAESARHDLLRSAKDLIEHGQLTPPERELLRSVINVFTTSDLGRF